MVTVACPLFNDERANPVLLIRGKCCRERRLLDRAIFHTGNRSCLRRLLSKISAGDKRRSKLIWLAILPAV